ncbi:hypothetical protein FA13DRAFT_343073 [Coprinellus micaceus]|uniref:MYND-type domain-containing protein n=1 Tax=Coprinellus micaceus TaxID=71717 RepID=A0A4Y7SE00_COPMI|nr:hypothetical protein FA13DRAFT_343073 [Coprinellus micaceus]
MESLRTCGGCHSVFYCSRECQTQDWVDLHSRECGVAAMIYHSKSPCLTLGYPIDAQAEANLPTTYMIQRPRDGGISESDAGSIRLP